MSDTFPVALNGTEAGVILASLALAFTLKSDASDETAIEAGRLCSDAMDRLGQRNMRALIGKITMLTKEWAEEQLNPTKPKLRQMYQLPISEPELNFIMAASGLVSATNSPKLNIERAIEATELAAVAYQNLGSEGVRALLIKQAKLSDFGG